MDYLERTTINRDLVLEFFLVLSRLEFALKVTGFASGSETDVKPNWEGFAKEIRESFNKEESPQVEEACNYYLDIPPQKQVLHDGALSWSSALPSNTTDIEKLLILVRRVRNNLFHGGKYNSQGHEETARNELLLRYGIIILKASMILVPQVEAAYRGAAI